MSCLFFIFNRNRDGNVGGMVGGSDLYHIYLKRKKKEGRHDEDLQHLLSAVDLVDAIVDVHLLLNRMNRRPIHLFGIDGHYLTVVVCRRSTSCRYLFVHQCTWHLGTCDVWC